MQAIVRTAENAEKIIDLLSNGITIKKACAEVGLSVPAFCAWRIADTQFDQKVVRACATGIDVRVDSAYETIDNEPDVNRARLRVDFTKWEASKRMPATYGDRLDVNVTSKLDLTEVLNAAEQRVLHLRRNRGEVIDAEVLDTKQLMYSSTTGHEPDEQPIQQQDQAPIEFDPLGVLK